VLVAHVLVHVVAPAAVGASWVLAVLGLVFAHPLSLFLGLLTLMIIYLT